ncbi:MAG: hypothetical protein FJ320_05315 [SAR202 cluster bacterium]|nr:hypothetical protein [SAR202 cluster bacterium]
MALQSPALLDTLLPVFHARESHSLWIPSSTRAAYEAVKSVTARDIRLFGPLMFLRILPARLSGKLPPAEANRPMLEQMARMGFVVLGEKEGSEIVLGAIGQFWRVAGGRACAGHRRRTFLGL